MAERYVVAGLARARTEWFSRVGRWATEGAIPVEFVRCVSAAELRARLDGGRPWSAVLLADDAAGVDRDLLATVRAAGAAPVVVTAHGSRDWAAIGAAALLPSGFGRADLVDVLARTAAAVDDVDHTSPGATQAPSDTATHGRLVAVTGPGGTGASTVAIALAQGLATDGAGRVLLADLRRVAEQAMLHDARVVVPGLQELVEAHRGDDPGPAAVRDGTFAVDARGYRLLLGLRRARQWPTLRPAALGAALGALRRAADVVVADVDPEVEGQQATGSADVEERHLASRLTLGRADVVVVVGAPGVKGLYSLTRLLGELLAFGVPPERVVTVVNRAPRRRAARAELTGAVARLLAPQVGADRLASPVFVAERATVEGALRDGVALPQPLAAELAAAVRAVLARAAHRTVAPSAVPVPVAPGSLGVLGEEPLS